jgi:hypothetical protein
MGFVAVYFILIFLAWSVHLYFKENESMDLGVTVNQFMIYYVDGFNRQLLQKKFR